VISLTVTKTHNETSSELPKIEVPPVSKRYISLQNAISGLEANNVAAI